MGPSCPSRPAPTFNNGGNLMKTIIKAMVLSATLICGNVVAEEEINEAEAQAVIDAITKFGSEAYEAGLRGADIETTGSYLDDLIRKIRDLRKADTDYAVGSTVKLCVRLVDKAVDKAVTEECGV